ncbi:homoserine O-acetyltransferase [Roseomonas sp. NAR14]|uniref:Probable acyltransferase n=1 Tax=Roseomonas acroporae TaxID=2937791 RepID=A0A9X2BWA5_9PROT|nr:homoserine O-acetyltransferase [Roseomonas acroporae]MCK8785831.1 homoserine O-acetyltransferase [Roseomonas acroporae]
MLRRALIRAALAPAAIRGVLDGAARRAGLAAGLSGALAAPAIAQAPTQAPTQPPVQTAPSGTAAPEDGLVEKKVFETQGFRTRGGATIPTVRLGYQTMGQLNAAGDNAVLICHFFSANSHAFGRYAAGEAPGYWDAIIGPGKAIDTGRFFVVSSDTLVNINPRDARTTTTGPATVNPQTGRPWGMEFPVIAMRDFVEAQKLLLDSLGVKRLALVAGPSNGALNTIEWACAYPEMIERAMPVIGAGEFDAWMIGWLDVWESPIRLDPNWRGGDYYGVGREAPLRGLAEALKIVSLHARDRGWARQFGRRPAEGQDPARRIGDRFAVEKWLEDTATARARTADANSFLYMVRANQLFLNEYPSSEAALANSKARWLVAASLGDRVFPIEYNHELVAMLRRAGRPVEFVELRGDLGHLEGVAGMAQAAGPIGRFLAG